MGREVKKVCRYTVGTVALFCQRYSAGKSAESVPPVCNPMEEGAVPHIIQQAFYHWRTIPAMFEYENNASG